MAGQWSQTCGVSQLTSAGAGVLDARIGRHVLSRLTPYWLCPMWTVTRFLISDLFAFTVFLRYTATIDLNLDPLEG
jgi:hypothetical protein